MVWQNLLAAEWVIFSFYQQGVEAFNASTFTTAGSPNTMYDRIQEIRDNEACHLRIFQNQISPTSVKPGACSYDFPFFDVAGWPAQEINMTITAFEERGIILAVVANQYGAPDLSSVIAGPEILLEQPEEIGAGLA